MPDLYTAVGGDVALSIFKTPFRWRYCRERLSSYLHLLCYTGQRLCPSLYVTHDTLICRPSALLNLPSLLRKFSNFLDSLGSHLF